MMTGCQKEQGSITLKAVISQDSKAYIGTDNYPFWNDDDAVNINGVRYDFEEGSVAETYAKITEVTTNRNGYYAIYPSRIVNSMENGVASITIPTEQTYKLVDGKQRLDIPMAAFTTGNTLYFKNLCSIVRVTVNNNTGSDLILNSIILSVDDYNICGDATVNIGQNSSTLNMLPASQAEVYHSVILKVPNSWTMNTISNLSHKDFDIIVPPFTGKDVYIRVETTSNTHYQVKVENASLGRSKIVPISLNVLSNHIEPDGPAILKPGPEIKKILQHYAASNVIFRYGMPGLPNATVFSRIDLEDGHCTPIYAYVESNSLIIRTGATDLYANPNSSHMFEGVGTDLSNSFDEHFKTDYVIDMSYMFADNPNMTSLGNLNTFNTTNVTTMAYMFAGDAALGQLNFFSPDPNHPYQSGNNSSLTNMEGMFSGCSNLSGLDMTNFTTSSVTNMKDLFNGCANMNLLKINNFTMSSVTNKTNMCTGLGEGDANHQAHTSDNRVQIYCPSTLVGTAENPGPLVDGTGLNTSIVTFINTGGSK